MEDYERNRFCPDEDCGGIAEPEEDLSEGGLLQYFKCRTCEMEFGYRLLRDEAMDGTCSLGVPEPVRKAASMPPKAGGQVFLGSIGRRQELWDWT
jgi:hypothetical protein